MSQCWSEGALRTYIDRELPPPEMELVEAHLAECAECAGMSRDLAARAARLAVWMDALPELNIGPEMAGPMPRKAIARRRWMGLAAAIAAGLAVAALVLPRHKNVAAELGPSVMLAPPAAMAAVVPDAAVVSNSRQAAPIRIRRPRLRPRTVNNSFLALDDEPIENGVIMRVGVEPGDVQADIVFGQDGRAHAIRLVSAKN
jgi:predicted anti-sigma-YlaC factor YlaD